VILKKEEKIKMKLLPLLILVFAVIPSLAQDSLKIVILSPKVGEVIDKNESEQYSMFKQYKNFSKVIFYKTSNDEYYGKFSFTQPDGSEKDTLVKYSGLVLFGLAEKIENWEKLKSGDYKMGQNPPKLTIKNGDFITLQDLVLKQKEKKDSLYKKELLNPFYKQYNFIEIETYPKFFAGIGIGFNNQNFKELKNAFYILERRLEEEGYSFTHHYTDNFSVNPLLNFFFKVSLIRHLDILFEISNSLSETVFRSAFVSLFSDYQIFNSTPFFVFAGAGVGSYYFKVEKKYNIYLKDGGTLESINAEGKKLATNISAGIKYELTKTLDLTLLGNYAFVPKITTIIETGDKISVDLKGFSGSLRFSVGF